MSLRHLAMDVQSNTSWALLHAGQCQKPFCRTDLGEAWPQSQRERKRAIVSFCQRTTCHCAGSSAVCPALPKCSPKLLPVGLAEASSEPD